jgi:hypothetical protein
MDYSINQSGFITRVADGAIIPVAPGNMDYEEYLGWVAEGNTPIQEASLIPVPESVLSHQFFTALSRHSISEATIAAIIAGMPEGQAKVEADLAFRRAPQIRRDHPIALGIAMALSLSTETVDEIFREAAEI